MHLSVYNRFHRRQQNGIVLFHFTSWIIDICTSNLKYIQLANARLKCPLLSTWVFCKISVLILRENSIVGGGCNICIFAGNSKILIYIIYSNVPTRKSLCPFICPWMQQGHFFRRRDFLFPLHNGASKTFKIDLTSLVVTIILSGCLIRN